MRRNEGYTIIELLTAVAIIGIVAAIGVPAVRSFHESTDVRATANQITTDLWLARQRSIATSVSHSVWFEPDYDRYQVFRDDGGGNPANAGNGSLDVGEVVLTTRNLKDEHSLSEVNLDPVDVVIFVPRGTLLAGTTGGSVTIADLDGRSRRVLVRATGMSKVD
jgi:prepilin-type N-terminal cleavage/methylation domain-containing protein